MTLIISKRDFIKILIVKHISKTNAKNKAKFIFSAQFNVEKPKTYYLAMSEIYIFQ